MPSQATELEVVPTHTQRKHNGKRNKPRRTLVCCTKLKDRSYFQNILEELDLPEIQKQIIKMRYLSILENFQRRTRNYSYIFFGGHFVITVGSLFIPAFLSIQNSDKNTTKSNENFSVQIYWATFIISVLVSILNGILTLFKVDKKYYFLNMTLERLRSEGWQYFGLTGRYSGHLIGQNIPTHKNQFMYFIHYIEKIKMKQVEEEYYKVDEKTSHVMTANTNNQTTTIGAQPGQEIYPLSPNQPLSLLEQTNMIPDPIKEAVNSLIISSKTVSHSKQEKQENQEKQLSDEKDENIVIEV
jgi:hypothetical protein